MCTFGKADFTSNHAFPFATKQSVTKEITRTKAILCIDISRMFLRIVSVRCEQVNFVLYKNGLMVVSILSVTQDSRVSFRFKIAFDQTIENRSECVISTENSFCLRKTTWNVFK